MTEFEYFTGVTAIVLGLTVARCLDALPSAFESGRRYWVHLAWVLVKLSNPIFLFWMIWVTREHRDFTFGSLIGIFALSATLYLQVTALVTTNPASVTDWAAHYFAKRRLFFGTNVFFLTQLLVINLASVGADAATVVQLAMIGLSVAAIASDRPRLHECLAVLAILNMFGGFFSILAV